MNEVNNLAEIVELCYTTGYNRANEKNIAMLRSEIVKEEHERLIAEISKTGNEYFTKEAILRLLRD